MVKNLNTVERSQRIRLGKVVPDDQAAGTIILNATDDAIAAPVSGLYVAPIRFNDSYRANTLVYNTGTGEISDSGHPAHQFQDLQNVTSLGATSDLRIDVSNTFTATQVGVNNTTPEHTLSVSGNTWIGGDLTVVGDTTFVQSKNLQISDPLVELGGNNSTQEYVFDVGLLYNRPDPKSVGVVYLEAEDELAIAYTLNTASDRYVTPDAANTLDVHVYGDVTANAFFGEGQYLQNVAVLSNFESNVARIETLEFELESNNVRTSNLEAQLYSNHVRTSNLETYATSNNLRVSTLELGQFQNANRLTTLYAYHASNVLRIEDLESNLVQNSNRIFVLSDDLADNSARISVLSTRLQDNSFRISVNTTNLLSNHIRVTNLESNLVANAARVTSLEGRATDLEDRASNLETNLGSNVLRIESLESNTANLRVEMDSNSLILSNTVVELDSNAARIVVLEAQGLDEVADVGNTVSNTVIFTNEGTSLVTDGAVGVNTRDPNELYELHVAGNVLVQSNVEATLFKAPGTELNVNGRNKLTGNTTIYGNLNVFGNVTYLDTENVYVKDPILGIGNPGASDSGVIAMSGGPGSNVAFGFNNTQEEFIICYTDDGPLGVTLTPNVSRDLNVHIYGTMYSANGFGVANTNPNSADYALSISNNIFARHDGDFEAIRTLGDTAIYSANVTVPKVISLQDHLTLEAPTTIVTGNLEVKGETTFVSTTDLKIDDAVIELANNNLLSSTDVGIKMNRPDANVLVAYKGTEEELIIAHSTNGVEPNEDLEMNVHVYGSMNVGSNCYISKYGHITANSYSGDGGLLSNIVQTLEGITSLGNTTTHTVYLQNATTGMFVDSNIVVDGNTTSGVYYGDGSYLTGVSNIAILEANLSVIRTEMEVNTNAIYAQMEVNTNAVYTQMEANTQAIQTQMAANTQTIFSEMAANTQTIFAEMAANAQAANALMAANTQIIFAEMASNTQTIFAEMAANTQTIFAEMAANAVAANALMAANTQTIFAEMAANTQTIYFDMHSNALAANALMEANVQQLQGEMAANTQTIYLAMHSNAQAANALMAANTQTIFSEMAANTQTIYFAMHSNALAANALMEANVQQLQGEMAANTQTVYAAMSANTVQMHADLQSNVDALNDYIALKSNIINPTFEDLVTVSGNLVVTNNLTVLGEFTQLSTINTIVNDALIEVGNNNSSTDLDLGIIMTRPGSNVGVGYRGTEEEFAICHTRSDPSGVDLTPYTTDEINVHVYGSVTVDTDLTAERVGINVSAPSTTLDVGGDIQMTSTFDGSAAAPELTLYKNSATPANADYLGQIRFQGENSTGGSVVYSKITGKIGEVTQGSEDGIIEFAFQRNSTQTIGGRWTSDALKLMNDTGLEVAGDLAVDTDTLFVDVSADKVGVNTSTPGFELDVRGDANVNTLNVYTIQGLQTLSFNSENTTTPPLQLTASALNDGVGALRIDSVEPDIFLNDTDGGFSTVTFASEDDSYAAIGRNNSNNFYITVRDPDVNAGAWRNDTFVAESASGDVSLGYKLAIGGSTNTGSNVLDVYGSANATTYFGDGGNLTGIATTLEAVTLNGNTTPYTVEFNNTHTALSTDLVANVNVKLDQLANVTVTSASKDQQLIYDGSDWVNDFSIQNFIKIYNKTGSPITRGKAVYIYDSHNANVANVALARANSSATMPAIGLVYTESIANGAEGVAIAYGKVTNVPTGGFIEGETVYVSNTTPGGISNLKPYNVTTNPDLIQNVGICIKPHATNGVVFVTGVGRSNDIPNALIKTTAPNYVYVNDVNNDMKKIAPENLLTKIQTLQQVTDAGNATTNVVTFSNATVGLTTVSNIECGGYVFGDGELLTNVSNIAILEANLETIRTEMSTNAQAANALMAANTQTIFAEMAANAVAANALMAANTQAIFLAMSENALSTNLLLEANTLEIFEAMSANALAANALMAANTITIYQAMEANTQQMHSDLADNVATLATILDPTFTSNITVSNGLVHNKQTVATKYYAYSGTMTNSNIVMSFTSNVFYSKIVAQLTHNYDDVSTMVLEVAGGKQYGGGTFKDIKVGTKNIFGWDNDYPWHDGNVHTTPTTVTIWPVGAGVVDYDYDISVEFKSSAPDAGLSNIAEGQSIVKYFSY